MGSNFKLSIVTIDDHINKKNFKKNDNIVSWNISTTREKITRSSDINVDKKNKRI